MQHFSDNIRQLEKESRHAEVVYMVAPRKPQHYRTPHLMGVISDSSHGWHSQAAAAVSIHKQQSHVAVTGSSCKAEREADTWCVLPLNRQQALQLPCAGSQAVTHLCHNALSQEGQTPAVTGSILIPCLCPNAD